MGWLARKPLQATYHSIGWSPRDLKATIFRTVALPGGSVLRVMDKAMHQAALECAGKKLNELAHKSGKTVLAGQADNARSTLLDVLDRLDRQSRISVACHLAALWDTFQGRFGRLDSFCSKPEGERAAHLNNLRATADLIRPTDVEVAIAIDLMTQYVAALCRAYPTASDRALVRIAGDLIAKGTARRGCAMPSTFNEG
jgi:hypothetical protein